MKDAKNIINNLNDITKDENLMYIGHEENLKNISIEEFEIQYKQEHPEIFNEINKKYEESLKNLENKSINFIKFLLEKYPPKDNDKYKSIDVEKEFKENPNKLMRELNKLYKSDHVDMEDDRKYYIIVKEIEVLITSLYDTIKKKLKKKK